MFGDFASQVAGDVATAETLVPVGQHGHGWEPGPKIQGDVLDADLFVHGVDGLQPWADDVAANVRDDGADTALVEVGSNVDLLDAGSHASGDHDGGNHDETTEHGGHNDESDHGGHDEGDGHDHTGGTDPHLWLDPLRAKRAVETVRAGFETVDEANADAYAENAEAYQSRLDELHTSFESALDAASKDVILVAGHDAFGYLAARYGFEVETLTGVSPDDEPTPKDVETAQHVTSEHDLDHVLADPLASQWAADLLALDEPAVGVDARSREQFYAMLADLNAAGLTVVPVEHDIGVVTSHASEIACLNRRLYFHGDPQEFAETDALASAYGADQRVLHHDHEP